MSIIGRPSFSASSQRVGIARLAPARRGSAPREPTQSLTSDSGARKGWEGSLTLGIQQGPPPGDQRAVERTGAQPLLRRERAGAHYVPKRVRGGLGPTRVGGA